jgi:hypothetical protein
LEKNFLFICGCARSGTTALWRLMVSHPKIVLGVERYVLLGNQKWRSLTPELFEKEKFFDLQPKETFYKSLSAHSYYEIARERFDDAQWIGDKIPHLFQKYDQVEAAIPGAHYIFIVRNIIDVAGSYQKRAETGSWKPARDYTRAVYDWQQSIETTLRFAAKRGVKNNVHIISYEELYLQAADLRPLFAKLGLEVVPSVRAQYRKLTDKSVELEKRRGDALTSAKRHYIALNAPFDAFREILQQRLVLSPSPAADSLSTAATSA